MEFWNLNPINPNGLNQLKSESNSVCPLAKFANYCKLASSQSNRHKYRLLQNQWPLGPNSLLASLYQPQFWSPPHLHQSRGRYTGLPQIPADTPQQLPSCRLGLIHWLHRVSLFRPATPLLLFNWRKDFQEYPLGCQHPLHPKRLNPQLHPPPLRCSQTPHFRARLPESHKPSEPRNSYSE